MIFLQALAVLENEQAKMVGASVDAKLGASGADDNVAELNAFQDHVSSTKYVMLPADIIACQAFMTEFIENGRALRKALNHFSSRLQFRYEPVDVRLSALPCVQFPHGVGGEAKGGGAPPSLPV